MRLSNSKKQLARLLIEAGVKKFPNGADWAAQGCIDLKASFYGGYKPKRGFGEAAFCGSYCGSRHDVQLPSLISNWHQTVLSRAEFDQIVAETAPDADVGSLSAALDLVTDENKHEHVDSNPTIEQLAADYHNLKDFSDRKQAEADAAKAEADKALRKLELAGEALGLLVSPINAKQESELAIEVKVGDEVECVESNVNPNKYRGMFGTVLEVDDTPTPYLVAFDGNKRIWCHEVKFIRRP